MESRPTLLSKNKSIRGGVLAVVSILLPVFIGVAALAIDIGYRNMVRNELQNIADSAALAGAGYLGSFYASNSYKNMTSVERKYHEFDRSKIVEVVQYVGEKNKAAGVEISIMDTSSDIIIGKWNPDSKLVGPPGPPLGTLNNPDAVTVVARRDDQANSPIATFFAPIFDFDKLAVTAEATAALSGPSWVAEGELVLPFGLSERLFPNKCGDVVAFSPTPSSCAGWHNFFDPKEQSAIADKMLETIKSDHCKYCTAENKLVNGSKWLDVNFNLSGKIDPADKNTVPTPETSTGDIFNFNGGNLAALFNGDYLLEYDGNKGTPYSSGKPIEVKEAKFPAPMFALFDYFRYRDDDGDNSVWTATVPVYKDSPNVNCDNVGSNPNSPIEIVAFARIKVMKPNAPPSTNIDVFVDCNLIIEERSGGGFSGSNKGLIPALVK